MDTVSPRLYVRDDGRVYGAYDPRCREAFGEHLFGMNLADAIAKLALHDWEPVGSTEGETVLFKEKGGREE